MPLVSRGYFSSQFSTLNRKDLRTFRKEYSATLKVQTPRDKGLLALSKREVLKKHSNILATT